MFLSLRALTDAANFQNSMEFWLAISEQRKYPSPPRYILFSPVNSFSTSATISSAAATFILPTLCQRMIPC